MLSVTAVGRFSDNVKVGEPCYLLLVSPHCVRSEVGNEQILLNELQILLPAVGQKVVVDMVDFLTIAVVNNDPEMVGYS